MKKVIMLAAVVAALASCQSKANKAEQAEADSLAIEALAPSMDETAVYTGILPAADGPGIRYVLTLNELESGNDTTFTLEMTYLQAENGKDKTVTTKGKPQVIHKTVKNKPKTAIKLAPSDGSEPMYFIIANDTTLTLANGNLEESASDLNYDIIKVK